MKKSYFAPAKPTLPLLLSLGLTLTLQSASANLIVDLGTASSFAVLAGSGITIAGAPNSTTITGNIGSFPMTTINGLGNLLLNGVNHSGDAVTQQARLDLATAYGNAVAQVPDVVFGAVHELGGSTLTAGVYRGPSSFGITGILTLDAGGDPNAVWIFQAGSTLITDSGSEVLLIGGAQASHVFWTVGSSATLGTDSHFNGSIFAFADITATTGTDVHGSLFALNGAVSLNADNINLADTNPNSVPEAGNTLLLCGFGLVSLIFLKYALTNLKS